TSVTFLDRAPDLDRFRRRMTEAVIGIPRLRQRVVNAPAGLGPPSWADDPDFDLDFHVRHVALPPPATERQLLDLAALLHEDAFDPARSLWNGKRSAGRRYEILSADLEKAKEAAHARGGTLNDLYVTAIAGAAGKYHRAKGAEIDELRASIPVSTRSDKSAGGNAFLPAR